MKRSKKQEAGSKKRYALSLSCFMFLVSCFFFLILLSSSSIAKSKKTPANATQEEPPISQAAVDALKKADLNAAAIALRDQHVTAKSLYLLKEVSDIVLSQTSKPKRSELHQFHQNIATAYHNILLFLKANGVEQDKFVNKAVKFYSKSKHYATPMHKTEADILIASLYVLRGDEKRADKLMKDVLLKQTILDFHLQEALAVYYAAKTDTQNAIQALEAAYKERPGTVLTWLAVGDDFFLIKNEPEFRALLSKWRLEKTKHQLELTLPEPTSPKLEFAEPEIKFRKSALKRAWRKTSHRKKAKSIH